MAAVPRPIVLVHGAWHGAWSWAALQHELDRRGLPSYAVDLPGRGTSIVPPSGLSGDVLAVAEVLDALGRDVVLVGHSYGGAVVAEVAARHALVAQAVFLCAFALVDGESVNGFLRAAPRHRVGLADHMLPQPDGSIRLDPVGAAAIYGMLPAAEVAAHLARLSPQPPGTFTDTLSGDPFGRVPTTYILCAGDDAVHPAHQELMAERCDRVVRLDCDHFPMLHSPGAVADVLEPLTRAARA